MANNLDRYYETLGLRPGASPREVRRAYLDLTKVWHPDRFVDDPRLKKKAEAQLREINAAYEHLCAAQEAQAPKQPAGRRGEARAEAPLARLPMPEIMALLVLLAVLAVLTVVVVACHQLTSSPAALLAPGLL